MKGEDMGLWGRRGLSFSLIFFLLFLGLEGGGWRRVRKVSEKENENENENENGGGVGGGMTAETTPSFRYE